MIRFGLIDMEAERSPMSIFVLDDDERRHRWFKKRFDGDELDIAETVEEAKEYLSKYAYDAVFLDHDLLPEHYESNEHDDFARLQLQHRLCHRRVALRQRKNTAFRRVHRSHPQRRCRAENG